MLQSNSTKSLGYRCFKIRKPPPQKSLTSHFFLQIKCNNELPRESMTQH